MKANINTKHLRILELLSFTNGKSIEFLELFLDMNKANILKYIKEIYKLIPNGNPSSKTEVIIQEILKHKNCNKLIKNAQHLSREDRIFFLTLKILIKSNVNLQSVSDKLSISRRTANEDIKIVKENLEIFNLDIMSRPGRGIYLTGEFENVKRALCVYIYKLLVEEQNLPKIFIDYFGEIIHNNEVEITLKNQLENFLSISHSDSFFYNRELLKSFYISFKWLDDCILPENKIRTTLQSFDTFELYFSNLFGKNDLKEVYDIIQNSLLGDISFDDILSFRNILRICRGVFPEEKFYLDDHFNIFKKIFKETLDIDIKLDRFVEKFILRASFVNKQSHYLPIFELSFLNLNLNEQSIDRCIALFGKLRKHYRNISFSDVISIFLWINLNSKDDEQRVTIVYSSIPRHFLEKLKGKIEMENNIIITDFININFLNEFKKNNDVNCIGIFESLPIIENDSIKIKTLTLPL